MPVHKNIIINPVTGEKIKFRNIGETENELKFDMFVEPSGFVAAEHVHPNQTEHFQVKEGELCLKKEGKTDYYHKGDEATITPGTSHVWWNSGDGELYVQITFQPANNFDQFLSSLFALAQKGKTNDQGMPNMMQIAIMMDKYDDVIYPSSPPRVVQKILFTLLAPIAKLFGYKADHEYPKKHSNIS